MSDLRELGEAMRDERRGLPEIARQVESAKKLFTPTPGVPMTHRVFANMVTMWGIFEDATGKLHSELTEYRDELDYASILPGFSIWEVLVRPVCSIERKSP